MKQTRTWIALIGSTPEIAQALVAALQLSGYTCIWFRDAPSFLALPLQEHPRCIVVDFDREQLQGGMATIEGLVRASWRWPLVVVNSRGDLPAPVKLIRMQNILFLDRAYTHDALLEAIRRTNRFKPYRMASTAIPALRLIRAVAKLTPREMAIAEEMLYGHSSKQIARRYHISEKTVEHHRSRVLQKMGVNSTVEYLLAYLWYAEN